jgi:hypothetical protein
MITPHITPTMNETLLLISVGCIMAGITMIVCAGIFG